MSKEIDAIIEKYYPRPRGTSKEQWEAARREGKRIGMTAAKIFRQELKKSFAKIAVAEYEVIVLSGGKPIKFVTLKEDTFNKIISLLATLPSTSEEK